MRRSIRIWVLGLLVAGGVSVGVLSAIGATRDSGTTNRVLDEALAVEQGLAKADAKRPSLSGGVIYAALDFSGALDRRADTSAAAPAAPVLSKERTQGCQNTFTGGLVPKTNIRVNQDCSLRRQAEEVIAIDPTNEKHMIAGQNDSRIGFNHCGYDWSFDGGNTWGDQVPPFYQFVMADGHTADACSDPTATFDSQGNAYVGGVLFDVGSNASAFVVAKSNAAFGGTFYHSPAPMPFQEYRNVPLGVVASDADDCIFHDKEFIVADAGTASPKKDNVYATWTRFTCENSPIYFSQSPDGGATWSPGIEISGSNSTHCTDFSVTPDACDQDQGSHPVVGTDGTIYVAFGNGNTPLLGINQILFVKCPASADCTDSSNWSAPVKVNDLIDNHPTGPSPEGCPAGRQCLPPNGYRVPEFTSITTSVDSASRLYVSWSDFRNGGPPCTGPASTATPPCDNDVFYSYSTDGGVTWSPERKITPAGSAQWQPWSGVSADGKRYFVAYYDRSYGSCERTGCNDITLATIRKAATSSPSRNYRRLTTSSMPNLTLANNPLQAGFLGDYMWLAVDSKGDPHVVWADTRGLGGTVEEDIYLASP
jgi:hypothetical protein